MAWLDKKLIITMGTGGAGKTTVSAALACKAALAGKKVLVMTIDPSQRLKTALGLENLQGEPVELDMTGIEGKLYASVLDSKQVFDDFVMRNGKDEKQSEAILKNRLYQRISSVLSGSQEFTAIESVLHHVESGQYDMVILDTPPATNAVDFLRSPQKFFQLFDEKVLSWFSEDSTSWIKKTISFGTKKATGVLERLVGKEFLTEIYDFFQVVTNIAPSVRQRAIASQKLFAAESTAFSLVSVFDETKVMEASDLYKNLKRQGYQLKYVFMNKAFPFLENPAEEDPLLSLWQKEYQYQRSLQKEMKGHFRGDVKIFRIQEQTKELTSLEALVNLSKTIDI